MTEQEVQAVADEMEKRAKAAVADKYKKVRDFVTHNTLGVVAGGAAVFAVLKFLL